MRRRFLLIGLVGLLALVGLQGTDSSSSAATQTAATSGGAVEVPGTATFYKSGIGGVDSISCAAAGDCAAGGSYKNGTGHYQAFVVGETNGSWGDAIEVPGTATLNTGGEAEVMSVSCAAAGDCAAGGYYTDGSDVQAFVVSETNGSWGDAIKVPGTATLSSGGGAEVDSVSCAAVGECTAGGTYTDGAGDSQAFVVSETNGSWGDAIEVPGTAILNSGGIGGVDSISCAAAGDCAAGGSYADGYYLDGQAFVVSETNGSWGGAIEVPGTATLNSGRDAGVLSVSCAAAGDCAAGGYYRDGTGHHQAFVVDETNGVWGDAVAVPGTAALNSGGWAEVGSISCAAAGDCAAGGFYLDGSGGFQAFVVSETNGSWGGAIEVPGTAILNSGHWAWVLSVSCAAAGDCAAGGHYRNGTGHHQAFVVGETNGSWGDAVEVPGTAALNSGGWAEVDSISCSTASDCAAGGFYTDGSGDSQAFVVGETNGSWGDAIEVPGTASPCVVPKVVGKALPAAKKKLKAAHCSVGTIKKVYSKVKRGRVVAQHPKAGRHLKNGAKVALTISKGKKGQT